MATSVRWLDSADTYAEQAETDLEAADMWADRPSHYAEREARSSYHVARAQVYAMLCLAAVTRDARGDS